MRKLIAAAVLCLAVLGCSKSSPSASGSPAPSGNPFGCDFTIPNAIRNKVLTQQGIDEAVASAPTGLRNDLRVVYEASLKYQNDVKAAQAAPESRRTQLLKTAAADLTDARYRNAALRVRAYFAAHCTGLRGNAPTTTP
jgi:hypothetical protein